jgi:hypothetical protein
MAGARVTPLVHNPGRLMVTTARVYFQPYNNVDPDPVSRWALRDVVRIVRRRHLLRHIVRPHTAAPDCAHVHPRTPKHMLIVPLPLPLSLSLPVGTARRWSCF